MGHHDTRERPQVMVGDWIHRKSRHTTFHSKHERVAIAIWRVRRVNPKPTSEHVMLIVYVETKSFHLH